MAFIDERREKAAGLVVVTHKPEIQAFFAYFMKKEWGKEDAFLRDIGFGEAAHFYLETKVWQFLPKLS